MRLSTGPARKARRDAPRPSVVGVALALAVAMLAGACGGPVPSVDTPTTSPAVVSSATPQPTATPSPASPKPGPSASATPAPAAITPCPGKVEVVRSHGTTKTDQSTDWSGYTVSSTSTPFTCVEATWTQPTIVCHGTSLSVVAFWVGIGGVGQAGLVQTGTQTQCLHGTATIGAWHQSLPKERYATTVDMTVAAGDRIHAQVLRSGRTSYALKLENLTTGASFSVTSTNKTLDPTTAEWIVEAPAVGCPASCRVAALPDFGTVTFSGVSTTIKGVNGPLDGSGFVHTRTTLVTSSRRVRAKVSSTGSDGRSFAVTWVRS